MTSEESIRVDVNQLGQAPIPENTSTVTDDGTPQILSKKAIKKAAKAERFAASKLERRAREKEAKKQKKRLIAEKRAAGELDDDEKSRRPKRPRIHFGGTVVVDLGFDEMMSEKEITSLCSQLAYTYSANRNAYYPFTLVYTSLNGRTFTRLEGMSDAGYKRWANTTWWHEGYERLWTGKKGLIQDKDESDVSGVIQPTGTNDLGDSSSSSQWEVQKNVIYLTADSENELTELRPDEIYIIGGICDHNRYKNLCLNKAKGSGIRTARLPIGRYLASLPTRKVLTVNQVFEILIRWVETKDWEEALYSVVPKRKFQAGEKEKHDITKVDEQADNDIGAEEQCTIGPPEGGSVVVAELEQDEPDDSDR